MGEGPWSPGLAALTSKAAPRQAENPRSNCLVGTSPVGFNNGVTSSLTNLLGSPAADQVGDSWEIRKLVSKLVVVWLVYEQMAGDPEIFRTNF